MRLARGLSDPWNRRAGASSPIPGNTADFTTLLPVVKRMRERFRIGEITVVADRGMVSQATLDAFENSDPPVRYIVGVRMRRQKEVSISVLGS